MRWPVPSWSIASPVQNVRGTVAAVGEDRLHAHEVVARPQRVGRVTTDTPASSGRRARRAHDARATRTSTVVLRTLRACHASGPAGRVTEAYGRFIQSSWSTWPTAARSSGLPRVVGVSWPSSNVTGDARARAARSRARGRSRAPRPARPAAAGPDAARSTIGVSAKSACATDGTGHRHGLRRDLVADPVRRPRCTRPAGRTGCRRRPARRGPLDDERARRVADLDLDVAQRRAARAGHAPVSPVPASSRRAPGVPAATSKAASV